MVEHLPFSKLDICPPSSTRNTTWRKFDDLERPAQRLKSFDAWSVWFLDRRVLANSGFIYLGFKDCIQCVFCTGTLQDWDLGDDPCVIHRLSFPDCPSLSSASCKIAIVERHAGCYGTVRSRLETFDDSLVWNNLCYNRLLAKAGFYSVGVGDHVRCYFCRAGFRNLRCGDNVLELHRLCYRFCKLRSRGMVAKLFKICDGRSHSDVCPSPDSCIYEERRRTALLSRRQKKKSELPPDSCALA
jgi:hypothetical protein